VPWQAIVEALERVKGESWPQFSSRHGDWGGTRPCGWGGNGGGSRCVSWARRWGEWNMPRWGRR